MIEFKGDDRDNSDSKAKLELGRQWQAQAGPNYRYFMVFKDKDFGIDVWLKHHHAIPFYILGVAVYIY